MLTTFVIFTAVSCLMDLVTLYAWRDHKVIREAHVGVITFVLVAGWAWAAWGVWLAVHGQTSGWFALACVGAGALGFAGFIEGIREEWPARILINLLNIGGAVFALAVAGVPQ